MMRYRRRASPLHAARAGVAVLWCLSLVISGLVLANPLTLGALAVATVAAGVAARVGRAIRNGLLLAVPLALLITVINALVSRDGLTVIVRLGDLPVLGQTDVTLEATVAGAVLGLRALVLILAGGALYSAVVDPDELLGLFRRVSFRSALSATIATRMVPVLLRDGRRLADAQRCRPGPPPSRATLLRATTSNVLDRALDVAAALEVRGYGAARRAPGARRPYSRHDLAFAASAVALLGGSIAIAAGGLAPFRAYPSLRSPAGGEQLACAAALIIAALAPFADRRGVSR
jgi:energy-coupling factor transport system permease protein